MTDFKYEIKNSIKQGFSEHIVEWYFREVGYKVFKFGYEAILSALKSCNLRIKRTSSFNRIRYMPDFIVVDYTGEVSFVEVKYRQKPETIVDEILKANSSQDGVCQYWPETLLVLVTPASRPYIRAAFVNDITNINDFKALSEYFKVPNQNVVERAIKKFEEVFESDYMFNVFNFKDIRKKHGEPTFEEWMEEETDFDELDSEDI